VTQRGVSTEKRSATVHYCVTNNGQAVTQMTTVQSLYRMNVKTTCGQIIFMYSGHSTLPY